MRVVGRYALYGAIAAGGMATVHLGRLLGPVGFSRTVAIKRLHAQYASDPEFVSMFLDEARLAARIRHPNVVPTLDVVATGGELFLVMDYVPGESLSRLARAAREKRTAMPLRVLSAVLAGVLHGLHSAHEAKDERGKPLGIVHRDVSPQNVLVGSDGVARVLDFGVAKAAGRMQTTKEGQIKGKLAYMPPEQLKGGDVSRQTDIYAAGVMLWELLTGQRLFAADNEGAIVAKVLEGKIERPSTVLARTFHTALDDKTMRAFESLDGTAMRALCMDPAQRFTTAREMALELERMCPPATASEVGDWVEMIAREVLHSRAALVAEIESSASMSAAELRENGVNQVLNSPAMSASGQNQVLAQTGPSGQTGPTPGMQDLARTLAMPSAPPGPGPVMPQIVPMTPISQSTNSAPFLPPYVDGPPVTQPSSISVSGASATAHGGGDGRAKPFLAAAAGVFVGIVMLVGALYLKARGATPGPHTGTMLPETTTTGTGTGAPTGATGAPTGVGAPTAETPPVATVGGDPVPVPTGTPTTEPPPPIATHVAPHPPTTPTPTGKRPGGGTVKPGPTTKPAPPPPPADDCNPNFTVGEDGVKRFKPQCFK